MFLFKGKFKLILMGNWNLQRNQLQFGSRDAPNGCQRNTNAMDLVTAQRFRAWDRSLCTEAEKWDSNPVGPQPLAWRLAPPAYRRWLAERSIQLGERQAKGEMNAGYIDDEIAILLGRLRAIMLLLNYWQVMREFGFFPADNKAQIGEGATVLGTDLFVQAGVILPPEDKLALYDEWLERVDRLKTIERSELKALNGTLNFGAFAIERPVCNSDRHIAQLRRDMRHV